MAKTFSPRVAKKDRATINLNDKLQRDLFDFSDNKLFEDASLIEIPLSDIHVKEQVRTKFNDSSIKELAKNIKANGLIQPLVLHKNKQGALTLICGERRFRAMTSIHMKAAPCFVLEGKTQEELMAIQFSENSSREALHYIDKADGILNYQKATKASERKIQEALGISKSEVHRSLLVAKLPKRMKEAAKEFNVEKYVLLEWDALVRGTFRTKLQKKILSGELTKRSELKKEMAAASKGPRKTAVKKKKRVVAPKEVGLQDLSAQAFLKALQSKSGEMKLDRKTKKLFKSLIEDTKGMVE